MASPHSTDGMEGVKAMASSSCTGHGSWWRINIRLIGFIDSSLAGFSGWGWGANKGRWPVIDDGSSKIPVEATVSYPLPHDPRALLQPTTSTTKT